VVAIVAVVAVIYLPGFLKQYGDRLFSTSRCTVVLEGEEYSLTAEQADNAALIVAVSAGRDLPARAGTIAIATAIQESSLRNIDYGDRDSVGLFQQRPSQGWGEADQIMDPHFSTGKFYDALVQVDGWQDLEITVAAQRVQRSAFPEAYGQHEAESRLWASALRGHSGPSAISCSLGTAEPSTAQAFAERVERDFGDGEYAVEVLDQDGEFTALGIEPASGDHSDVNAMAAWAVAVASVESVHSVTVNGAGWSRDDDEYEASGRTSSNGVTVTVLTGD
jgi:hypothetical protein